MSLQDIRLERHNAGFTSVRYRITNSARDDKTGFLTGLFRQRMPRGTMIQATDFSYQKFKDSTRVVAGHELATRWVATVGDVNLPVADESQWHLAILYAQQFELLNGNLQCPLLERTLISFRAESGNGNDDNLRSNQGTGKKRPFDDSTTDDSNRSSKSSRLDEDELLGRPTHQYGLNGAKGGGENLVTTPITKKPITKKPQRDVSTKLREAAAGVGLYDKELLENVKLEDVARYFGVPVTQLQGTERIQLLGTKRQLHLHQTLFVYRYLQRLLEAPMEKRAQVLSDSTGLGKTLCCFALVAELRGIEIEAEHVRANPTQHLAPGTSLYGQDICPRGGSRAGECVCVDESIRGRWASRLFGGPFLAFVSKGNEGQWIQEANKYFHPYIDDTGSGHANNAGGSFTEFIIPYVWNNGFKSNLSAKADPALLERIKGKVTLMRPGLQVNTINREDSRDFRDITNIEDKNLDPFKAADAGVRVDINRVDGFTPGSKLLIFPASAIRGGESGVVRKMMASTSYMVQVTQPRMKKGYDLDWEPSIAPTLVVLDESHELPKPLLGMMSRILAVTHREEGGVTRAPLWLFASATPWKGNLSSVGVFLPYIFPERRTATAEAIQLSKLVAVHKELEKSSRSNEAANREQIAELRRSVETFLGRFTIARREGTPIGDGRVLRLQERSLHEEIVHIPALQGNELLVVEQVGNVFRQVAESKPRWATIGSDTLFKEPTFIRYYQASLMPGLALAHETFPEYPCTVKEIRDDLAKNDRSLIRTSMNCHQNSEWQRRMEEILRHARGDSSTESGGHVARHVLIVTDSGGVAEFLRVVLEANAWVRQQGSNVRIELIVAAELGPGQRLARILAIRDRVQGAGSAATTAMQVIISTANSVGTGLDCLSFCSYLVVFGDLQQAQHYEQAKGRVYRQGQEFDVRIYRFQMDHPVQELIRRRQRNLTASLTDTGVLPTRS